MQARCSSTVIVKALRQLRRWARLLALALLCGPAVAAAPLPEPEVLRDWIHAMKEAERGPFARIRWYCADGTVLPPRAYACVPHGGGVQQVVDITTEYNHPANGPGTYVLEVADGKKNRIGTVDAWEIEITSGGGADCSATADTACAAVPGEPSAVLGGVMLG